MADRGDGNGRRSLLPLLILLAAIWGGAFPAIRLAEQEMSPLGLTLARFEVAGLAAALVLAAVPRFRRPIHRADLPALLLLGAASVPVYHIPLNIGLQSTGASVAALIVVTNPVWTALFSHVLGTDRIRAAQAAGLLLAFIGTALVVLGGAQRDLSITGLAGPLLVLISPIAWASYTVVGARYLPRYSPVGLTLYALVFGTLLLLPVSLLVGAELRTVSTNGWTLVLYLGLISTTLANVFWYAGLEERGAVRLAVFIFLMPLFALLFSYVLLGEVPGILLAVGGPFVVIGIALANRKSPAAAEAGAGRSSETARSGRGGGGGS